MALARRAPSTTYSRKHQGGPMGGPETPRLPFAQLCPRCLTRGFRNWMQPRVLCLRCGARLGEIGGDHDRYDPRGRIS